MNKLYLLSILSIISLNLFAQIQPPAGMGNNIILWLSPDTAVYEATNNTAEINDRVREWHDISGGGYVFTNAGGGERPRYVNYQGKRVLNFVNGDLLENSTIANIINGLSEFSIYVVIKSDDTNTDQGFLDSENPDGADEIICMRYDANGANTGRTNLIKCGMQGNTANNQVESTSNTQTNQLQCLTLTWKQGEKINLYIDGVLNQSSVNNLNSTMSGVQKILLGKGPKDTGNNSGWDGRIGTVIFYNTKMSPDTVSQISGDLKSINSVQSGNWNDPNTWDCNCNPSNNAFVKINNGHTVTLATNETANNLIIASGGNLDLSTNNRRLTLRRDFTNNGTLIPRNGLIRMNGSVDQFINGNGTTNFYNLEINKTIGNVTINNGNATIQGTLDIQNGCLNTNNRLTVLSNANGTGRIASLLGTACINGDITMQRYIDAGSTDWRFLTSAVNGTTLADFNDDFITSGFTGSDWPNWPSAANPWPSIYFYDETAAGTQDNGFVAASNITNPVAPGEGIWVWSGDTITGTQPFTIDMTGAPNTGNIAVPLSYTNSGLPLEDGWNMVGNPYPSSIDWDSPSIVKTNINNAVYIWNPDLQQFGSYIGGIGINGGSNNIASSQAFWVQGSALNPAILFTEVSKTSIDASFLKPSIIQPFKIRSSNSHGSDELAINFEPNSTINFDANYDALKMISVNTNLPQVASVMGNNDFSINQLPQQEISLPIKITTGSTGLAGIKFENIAALGNTACLIFEDLQTGIKYDLTATDTATVYLYDSTTVARFILHVGANISINETAISCNGNTDGAIAFTKNTTTPYDITWKNSNNITIASNSNIISDSLNNLAAGVYYIETTDATCGNRIDTVNIIEPAKITSHFTTLTDTINLGDSFMPTNQSLNATTYTWDFGDGNTSNFANAMHTYNQPGNYLVNLRAMQNSNCYEDYSKIISVVNATGIEDNATSNETKAWINNDVLTVNLNSDNYKHIEVRNTLGQVIYNGNVSNSIFTLSMHNYSNGVYFILLTATNDVVTTEKVVYSR